MMTFGTDLWHQLAANPWLLAYAAGCITGWHAARRATATRMSAGEQR